MVPKVKDQIGDDSLMNSGTWAYLGSEKKESDRYLFWTSVNTDEIGPYTSQFCYGSIFTAF